MPATSTERGRKHADAHPSSARDRKAKQRATSTETPYRVLEFYARHHIRDLSKMPPFPDAAEGERDRAIKEANEAFGREFYKMETH